MALEFVPVLTEEDIKNVSVVADDIWHEYWPGILSYTQVDYMVDKFQSEQAIGNDIKENGYEYWFLKNGGRIVGYTGGKTEQENNRYFISKIYLYAQERGKGYASAVIAFYEKLCRERKLNSMYLTVNKYNEMATRAYISKGFEVIDSVVTSIGEGFVMDDFIMEKKI